VGRCKLCAEGGLIVIEQGTARSTFISARAMRQAFRSAVKTKRDPINIWARRMVAAGTAASTEVSRDFIHRKPLTMGDGPAGLSRSCFFLRERSDDLPGAWMAVQWIRSRATAPEVRDLGKVRQDFILHESVKNEFCLSSRSFSNGSVRLRRGEWAREQCAVCVAPV